MILQDFLVRKNGGFYCRYGDFYLDPGSPVQHAVISHGHGDHATPGHAFAYCTPPTFLFMELRFARIHLPQTRQTGFHQAFQLGEVTLTFIPAGHMLGSAQVLMEHRGIRYLYTGDYKLQADPTCEAYEGVEADVLITETTFADPQVSHPDPVEEIRKLSGVRTPILLGAYSLGKAQRLTAMIHHYCPEKTVLVHHGIIPIHRIYESFGIDLGPYQLYNRKAMKSPDGHENIYMVPPMTFRSYARARNVVRVFASGWQHLQQNNHLDLYISDHVDWQEILQCIGHTKPQEVWTIHGDGRHLLAHLGNQIPIRII